MYCLTVKVISRAVTNYLPRYECNRGIKFLRNIFKKSAIRVPLGLDIKDYKPFYHFPHVSGVSYVVKLRNIKCGIISSSILLFIYFYNKGELQFALLYAYVTMALSYLLFTFYLAYIGKNTIGKMYLHKDMKEILISYINNSGTRSNISYKIHDMKVVDHPNILLKKFFKKVIVNKPYKEFNLYTYKTVKVNSIIFDRIFPNVI